MGGFCSPPSPRSFVEAEVEATAAFKGMMYAASKENWLALHKFPGLSVGGPGTHSKMTSPTSTAGHWKELGQWIQKWSGSSLVRCSCRVGPALTATLHSYRETSCTVHGAQRQWLLKDVFVFILSFFFLPRGNFELPGTFTVTVAWHDSHFFSF